MATLPFVASQRFKVDFAFVHTYIHNSLQIKTMLGEICRSYGSITKDLKNQKPFFSLSVSVADEFVLDISWLTTILGRMPYLNECRWFPGSPSNSSQSANSSLHDDNIEGILRSHQHLKVLGISDRISNRAKDAIRRGIHGNTSLQKLVLDGVTWPKPLLIDILKHSKLETFEWSDSSNHRIPDTWNTDMWNRISVYNSSLHDIRVPGFSYQCGIHERRNKLLSATKDFCMKESEEIEVVDKLVELLENTDPDMWYFNNLSQYLAIWGHTEYPAIHIHFSSLYYVVRHKFAPMINNTVFFC
jgi:hypothetical protein